MARVYIEEPREQSAHFGLYRTSAGGDDTIFVRRKVGEPTDYLHTKSRKLAKQRTNLTLASQHYASLTPSQKAITRYQMEEVDYIKSHGKSDTKLLRGRQLFIAKEMKSLETTGTQLILPIELCIMLVDENHDPLDGTLWLRYKSAEEWLNVGKEQLAVGSWLFSQIPRGQEAYRPYGEADNYTDPELPEHQFMSEAEIKAYHYHILWSTLETHCYIRTPPTTTGSRIGGFRQGLFFRPTLSFGLKQIQINLRRHYPPDGSWPESGFLAIHRLAPDRTPIDPPLHTAVFDIDLPPWPEWDIYSISFPSVSLSEGTLYALIFGTYPPYDESKAVDYLCGQTGTCWAYGTPTHAWSKWYDEDWLPWHLYNTAFMCYEMKA